MTDPPQEFLPGAVDFHVELSAFADSAVYYHHNRTALTRGATIGELVDGGFERAVAAADAVEQRAKAAHATACRKGCAWCCYQNVRATAAEVFHLVRWLRAHFSAAKFAALSTHVREVAARLRGMSQLERARARIACALLDPVTGTCRVHAARPLLCRGQLSISAQTCQRAMESPDQNRFEPLLEAIHGAGLASMSLELEFAFIAAGPVSGELTAMLAVALTDPIAETRWSRGENPFPRHHAFSTHLNSRMARMLAGAWARLTGEGCAAVEAEDLRAAAMKYLRDTTGADEPLQ